MTEYQTQVLKSENEYGNEWSVQVIKKKLQE
jgi:hypothetical protein